MNLKLLKSTRGQIVPLATTFIVASVVMTVAIVNVYQVAKAKLRLQNLADAAALNVASLEAEELNMVADRNEALNHQYLNGNTNALDQPPSCYPDSQKVLPRLDCLQDHTFASPKGATNYGITVANMNASQMGFWQSYWRIFNEPAIMASLRNDIPDLRDPTIHIRVWNRGSLPSQNRGPLDQNASASGSGDIAGIVFQPRDVRVNYMAPGFPTSKRTSSSLGGMVGKGVPVGPLEIDQRNLPLLRGGGGGDRVGAVAELQQLVPVLGTNMLMKVTSTAYVVPGSGSVCRYTGNRPRFLPTFYVRLGK